MSERDSDPGTMGDTSGVLTLQCYLCKHFGNGGMGCKAFPGSIPPEILHMRFDHRHPWFDADGVRADVGVYGDESILFEPNEYATPEKLARLEEDLSNWTRNYTGPVSAK